MNRITHILFPSAFLLLGLAGGWCLHLLAFGERISDDALLGYPLRDDDSGYHYVKPLLACNISAAEEPSGNEALHTALTEFVDTALADGKAENVSVYYRDLDSGLWTGIHTDDVYEPASLFKVPVLIAYLKQAEQDPTILEKTVSILTDPTDGAEQYIAPDETVQVGEVYTIEELLKLMTIYSDNRAFTVLRLKMDTDIRDEILEDLAIPPVQDDYTISPRLYSRLFRVLYNGTYLSHDHSELALSWLAQSAYADGLRAGTSEELTVAHKFGDASVSLTDGKDGHQLHDCGIIYDEKPYLLCVMTQGQYTDRLAGIIADVARITAATRTK